MSLCIDTNVACLFPRVVYRRASLAAEIVPAVFAILAATTRELLAAFSTDLLNEVRLEAWRSRVCHMVTTVRALACEDSKVLFAVIGRVVIQVVNHFAGPQLSSKFHLGNQNIARDISRYGARVIGGIDINASACAVMSFAAFPSRGLWSPRSQTETGLGAILSEPGSAPRIGLAALDTCRFHSSILAYNQECVKSC